MAEADGRNSSVYDVINLKTIHMFYQAFESLEQGHCSHLQSLSIRRGRAEKLLIAPPFPARLSANAATVGINGVPSFGRTSSLLDMQSKTI